MSVRFRRLTAVAAAVLLAASGPGAVCAAAEEPAMNPHQPESCVRCHGHQPKQPEPGKTKVLSSREEPHAAVAAICRSCHKDGKPDFWLLVLPSGESEGAAGAKEGASPAAPAAPAKPVAEGFENSHDAMECTGCHDKPADQLKPGAPPPARFASQGADTFCRSCHSGVDRSHFPRGNVPVGETTCTSCHRTHGRAMLFPSLRDNFPTLLADSTDLNPHGGKIFCLVCHPDTPQPGAPVVLRFPGDSLRLCQRCHPGVEHHPLKVKSTTDTWKMDFSHAPLENEGVVCISCHKPLECRGATGRENPRFLRGGPYNSGEEFCQICHEDKKLSSLNPHDQIDETGTIYRKKCLYCHVTVPDPAQGGEDLQFTDSKTALCVSCHQAPPHPEVEHLGRMTPSMLANLREYQDRRMVRLPLEDGTRLTCVTCHNPHERGLLKGPPSVGADEDKRLRLTTYNEQCTPCHGRH